MFNDASGRKPASKNGDQVAVVQERAPQPPTGAYIPADVESVDIFKLLDQLEELPEKAKHPLGMGSVLVGFDSEQFYYLVLKIRANLPDDMKKAQRVARDSERIVDEARDAAVQQLESGRAEAGRVVETARTDAERAVTAAREEGRRIIESARVQAAQMVEKSEVHQIATAQAHDILRRAETEASEIRKGADDYAKDVLANLEGVVTKTLSTIQRGKDMLASAR